MFAKEPIPQITKLFRLLASEKYSKAVCTAPQICESIKPIKSKTTLLLTFLEIPKIKKVIKRLPVMADRTMKALPIKKTENRCKALPANMLMATINEAPELIPNTKGPAKGFLKIICRIKPETESVQPAIIAVIVLGKRMCQKIKLLEDNSLKLIRSLPPKNKLKRQATISRHIKIKNFMVLFFFKLILIVRNNTSHS